MKDRYYIAMVKRAVQANDATMLKVIAQQLCDCEDAKRVLRLKGYGRRFMSTGDTARLVPMAKSRG